MRASHKTSRPFCRILLISVNKLACSVTASISRVEQAVF